MEIKSKDTRNNVKVAVILHPVNWDHFYNLFRPLYWPYSLLFNCAFKIFPEYHLKNWYAKLPPHIFMQIKDIEIDSKKRLSLYGIMCPMFSEQMVLNKDIAIKKIIKALRLAEKNSVKITALAGFTSIITNGGDAVLGKVNTKLTSGNTLTAALTIESINRALTLNEKNIDDCSLAVVGATGDIGSICAKIFCKKVKKLIVCSRSIDSSSKIVRSLQEMNPRTLVITNKVKAATESADIVITATSAVDFLVEAKDLKSGCIVCDVSMPANIAKHISKERKDVFVFEGGRASLSFFDRIENKKWNSIFPNNSVYGCLVEAIVLALEEKFQNYSIGKGNITEDKIHQMINWSRRNGVKTPEFEYITSKITTG